MLSSTLAACTQHSEGTPQPDPTQQHQPSDAGEPNDPFTDLAACDLLDDILDDEDFPPGEKSSAGGKNACQSTKQGFGSVSVNLQAEYQYDEFTYDSDKIFPGEVNQRRAVQIRDALDAGRSCDVSMEIEPDSRAIVGANMRHGDTDDACGFVEELAERLEPLLPEGTR
ncbi:DUF3558 family protein [Haloechinothrix sp. YIM 98757]|uniref:DUF3558 family protein n=1 Tax=Haloechinothrix aidingensis TaxID=2752311 RepID=A0A837ZZF6_9PSEU|nr:DUF3558 family protein [Haloechinothrix aidingensis]